MPPLLYLLFPSPSFDLAIPSSAPYRKPSLALFPLLSPSCCRSSFPLSPSRCFSSSLALTPRLASPLVGQSLIPPIFSSLLFFNLFRALLRLLPPSVVPAFPLAPALLCLAAASLLLFALFCLFHRHLNPFFNRLLIKSFQLSFLFISGAFPCVLTRARWA